MPGSIEGRAFELFAEYLARREGGEEVELESLCAAHPEEAERLRALERDHRLVEAAVQKAQWEPAARVVQGPLQARSGAVPGAMPAATRAIDPGLEYAGIVESAVVQQLAEHSPPSSRYELQGELARGGMGAIFKIWDKDLRRTLAMKVVLGKEDAGSKGTTPPVEASTLGRFLEEAQVTGQLDHPGVVPVHELGVDAQGCVYFTMRLVKGRDLGEILELSREGKEGWTRTRVLGVILKVCEAMAYAHSKGVVHRDLKPANIMVGRFGEVYVMDWGLAKVTGRKDPHDLRLRPPATTTSLRTVRSDRAAETPDSPIITMDGTVVGTPAYMPPEQAQGRVEELGPRADVYAVGAILYQLLTGQRPYVRPGTRMSPYTILLALLQGPPTPIEELTQDVPAELAAICEKAMARDPGKRYPDMSALAEDLRAYLEHRVVKAYQTGALAELRKWVERNKGLATASAAAALALVLGLGASSTLYVRARENERLAKQEARRAKAVQDFLTDSLKAASPMKGNPFDYRMRDWLDSVASQLGASFSDQPQVRSSLELVLASCYGSLTDYWSGYHLAKKSLADLELSGLQTPESRGRILVTLADAVIRILQEPDAPEDLAEEGLSALNETVRLMRDSGDDWAIQISAIELSIAFLETLSGRSEMWPEPFVECMTTVWGDTDLERVRRRLDDFHSAFNALWESGKREEAKDLFREDCRKQSEKFGSRATVAEFLRRIGLVAQRKKSYAFAEACFELALEYLSGNEVDETVRMKFRLDLVHLYREVERWDEALSELEVLLPDLRRLLGPAHEETCLAVRLLADSRARAGLVEKALEDLQQLRELVVDELGPETSELALTLHAMADILRREGRDAEAFDALRDAALVPVGTTRAEQVEHVRLLLAMGDALVRRSELAAAQTNLERAWAEVRDVVPVPGALADECERELSRVLEAQAR